VIYFQKWERNLNITFKNKLLFIMVKDDDMHVIFIIMMMIHQS